MAGVGHMLSRPSLAYVASISYALYILHAVSIQGWMNDGSPLMLSAQEAHQFCATFFAAHVSTSHWEVIWQLLARQLIANAARS
jgi:peptidoglycan/LPS O-acetylase OafA/YrhL